MAVTMKGAQAMVDEEYSSASYASVETDQESDQPPVMRSKEASIVINLPEPPIKSAVENEFRTLKARWLREQKPSSKLRDIVLSMPYQQIIGLGKPVLPYLFADLRTEPWNWFWALEAITRENPIPDDAEGDSRVILDAWLRWADEHGF